MKRKLLAKSAPFEISQLGLGTVKFGRNQGVKYPSAFFLPSDYEIMELLECAKELGINLLDTAPAYGNSEERLGAILQGQRKQWVISTKVGEEFHNGESSFDFSKVAIEKSIERSLKRLHTDYLDIVLVHSNGDDLQIIDEERVFDTLRAMKEAGKIRAYGMSSKTVAGGLRTLQEADVAMVTFNSSYLDEVPVIQQAHLQQKGILIKKAFASGHATTSIADTLQLIFNEPGVSSVVVGTINTKHLRENVLNIPK